MFPFGITVTLMAVASIDRHGDKIMGAETDIPNCAFAPSPSGTARGSSEDTEQGDQVIRDGMLFLPPTSPHILPNAKMRLPGEATGEPAATTWQVDGSQANWANPWTGWNPGREIRIRRVTG